MVTPESPPPAPPPNDHSPWRIRPAVLGLGFGAIVITIAVWWAVGTGGASDPSPATTIDLSDLVADAPAQTERAPDFAVPVRGGGDFVLADHLAGDGRPVFMNLWASWCLPCRDEMPAIDAAAERHPDVAFVGIAVQDDAEDAEAFAEEIGVTYTIGFDIRDQVSALYPALGLPATFLIGADGTIVDTYIGTLTPAVIDELTDQLRN